MRGAGLLSIFNGDWRINCAVSLVALVCWLSLTMTFNPVEAALTQVCPTPERNFHRQGICGPRLSQTIKTLCRDFNSRRGRKGNSAFAAAVNSIRPINLRKRDVPLEDSESSSSSSDGEISSESSLSPFSAGNAYLRNVAMVNSQMARTFVKSGARNNDVMSRRRRSEWQEKSIVCECCYNYCTFLEMVEYC